MKPGELNSQYLQSTNVKYTLGLKFSLIFRLLLYVSFTTYVYLCLYGKQGLSLLDRTQDFCKSEKEGERESVN